MKTSHTTVDHATDTSPLIGAGVGLLVTAAVYAWDLLSVNWLGWFLSLAGMA